MQPARREVAELREGISGMRLAPRGQRGGMSGPVKFPSTRGCVHLRPLCPRRRLRTRRLRTCRLRHRRLLLRHRLLLLGARRLERRRGLLPLGSLMIEGCRRSLARRLSLGTRRLARYGARCEPFHVCLRHRERGTQSRNLLSDRLVRVRRERRRGQRLRAALGAQHAVRRCWRRRRPRGEESGSGRGPGFSHLVIEAL